MRRACFQEAHVPGHPSLAGVGPGCGPTAPTSHSVRQKARDDLLPAPSIHVSLSLEVAVTPRPRDTEELCHGCSQSHRSLTDGLLSPRFCAIAPAVTVRPDLVCLCPPRPPERERL